MTLSLRFSSQLMCILNAKFLEILEQLRCVINSNMSNETQNGLMAWDKLQKMGAPLGGFTVKPGLVNHRVTDKK